MAETTQGADQQGQVTEAPVTEFEVAELQTTGDEQSGPAATPAEPVPAEEKEELKGMASCQKLYYARCESQNWRELC